MQLATPLSLIGDPAMNTYYVYAYIRKSNGIPYYIGKGKGRRAYATAHTVSVPKDKSKIVFLEKNLTNVGACALERRYIRWYGDVLYNRTEGGEGNTGPRSDEWRKNHSKIMSGRKHSKETIQKMKKIDKSYTQTDEYRKKCSQAAYRRSKAKK